MKALVSRAGKVQMEIRPIPEPGYGEVVVRTTSASICSADPAAAEGSFDVASAGGTGNGSLVLGHEGVGVVHMVGAGVEGFARGDRVMTTSTASCGHCENCQRGVGGQCRGIEWGGYALGVSRDGCLAEYFVVPYAQFNLAHVPAGTSDEGALFVADSFATGSSAIEGAQLPFGGTVLVLGQGHIGLGATAAARIAGAGLVITVKNRPGGEELSISMGADLALNHTDHDVRAEIERITEGNGVDLAIEASGAVPAFELAVELTRLGGQISGVAEYSGGGADRLPIELENWGWGVGDKSIRSRMQPPGSARTKRLLRLIASNRVDPAPMFTHEYDFDDVLQAFEDIRGGIPGMVKPLIRF